MRILISAGEASGEMYGAQLMETLRAMFRTRGHVGMSALGKPALSDRAERGSRMGPAEQNSAESNDLPEFFGVGGPQMRAAGCDIVVDAHDLSVVGITEILGHLPKIWSLFSRLIGEADRRKPDLAIVIDSPAFNWRVARQMKKRGIPVVYYVCPQFWAWRQGRTRLLRKYVDKALVIFPFEEKFYRDRGVDAEFVGHPLADLARPAISREEYAAQHGLDTAKQWVALMPGSRRKEVKMNLPEILQSAAVLGQGYEFLLPVAPTLNFEFMQSQIAHVYSMKEATTSIKAAVHLVPESIPALAHSRAGIIASGTATVEAAMMDLPFVMVYRVTRLTYLLGRWTVKVPHFAMVNLIANEEVVPELVQHDFTPENVVSKMREIIPDNPKREDMLTRLQRVKALLRGPESSLQPTERAAQAIFELCSRLQLSGNC